MSIEGNKTFYAYVRRHSVTNHSKNNIPETVKFGVGDLRDMPLIKKSHVAYSQFFSRS